MSNGGNDAPEYSGLPEDAERLGLTPLTAPGLRAASSLRSDRGRDKVLAWIALVAILAVLVAVLVTILANQPQATPIVTHAPHGV